MSILTHTVKFNKEVTFTDHTGVSFVKNPGQPSEETAVPALAAPLFLTDETSPSDILSYNNVEWVADPVAGDVVEFRYSGGNYEDEDGEAMDSQILSLFNCLGPALKDNSTYDSVQNSTAEYQYIKVATGATYLRLTNLAQSIDIGFVTSIGEMPSAQSVSVDSGVAITDEYIAFKATGTPGTFRIEQTKEA